MRYLEEFNCALLFSVQIWKELKYFQMEISFVFFVIMVTLRHSQWLTQNIQSSLSEDYINNGINDDIFKEQNNNKQTNNKILTNKTKTQKKEKKETKNERRMDTCVQKKTNGLQNYECIIENLPLTSLMKYFVLQTFVHTPIIHTITVITAARTGRLQSQQLRSNRLSASN